MNYYMLTGIKIGVAVLLAVLFGNGCVVAFNRIPVRWFEETTEDGERRLPEGLMDQGDGQRQRIPSTPWKYIFVAYFAACGIFLALRESLIFEITVLFVLAVILEMAISDLKYQIVPDPLSLMLAISAVGFISFQKEWWEPLAGAALAAAIVTAVFGLGRLIYHRDIIGGADLKFFMAIGLISGRSGMLIIFVVTQILIGIHALYRLLTRRAGPGTSMPMLPYAFAASTVYFLFLWDAVGILQL